MWDIEKCYIPGNEHLASILGSLCFQSEQIQNGAVSLNQQLHRESMKYLTTTPYNYQEYEFLRSAFGLPVLIKKYGYPYFEKAL